MNEKFNDELDLIEILRKIYSAKKIILIASILFSFIGVVYALLSPIKYSSSTMFITQNQNTNSSSISGVASLVGINLGTTSSYGGDIPSSMYPQIGDSPKFKRLMLNEIIDKKNNITLKEFIIDHYELDESNSEKISSPLFSSTLEEKCFNYLSNFISISVNAKDGYINISAIMPVAEYAAVLAVNAKDILQKIIIENKIESAKQNLEFTQNQLDLKKIEFDEIQNKLSFFKDSNLNLVNSSIINEQDKLEAEFQIINAVVTELAKQVEQAKLQVTKDTPVFSTIKEPIIPNVRTSPERTKIVITFTLLGFISSCFFVIFKNQILKIYKEILS